MRRVGEGVGGSIGLLDTKQLAQLDAHLQTNLYLSAKAVGHWAKETFGVSYTESGMTAVLHRLGYVYKKPRLVPGKADREAQEQFLETYDNIRNTKGQDDPNRLVGRGGGGSLAGRSQHGARDFKRYREDGLEGLRRVGEGVGGSIGLLDTKQLAQLDAHLQTNLYLSAKAVGHWAKETFGVSYTESGMTAVLHRLGYVYKKPRLVPGKADREAQEQFLETYDNIRNTKGQDDPIIFMDATHPQHNPVLAGGWIKRGEEQEIPTNTGRRRVNINGAIDLERLEPVVRFDDTINADSTLALFQQLEAIHVLAVCIYVICDNAPYYRSKAVQAYLKTSRIKLIFIPPYAPNLNLIERLWKFFKKKVLYNRYYETFGEFRSACETFFQNPRNYHCELRSLLTANFEIIG